MEPIWAIGLMTGTVLDGNIDVALLRTDGETIAEFGTYTLAPYPQSIRDTLEETLAQARRLVMEQNYALSGRYDQNQAGGAIDAAFIAATGFASVPPGGSARYNISFVAGTLGQGTYQLQAVPAGGQASDPCGTLLLNQQGIRGAGGVLGNRAQLTLD